MTLDHGILVRIQASQPAPACPFLESSDKEKKVALKKCPFCQSIIDEELEFCSACGTQLLFPEDDQIEEEIPGEKIKDRDSGSKHRA